MAQPFFAHPYLTGHHAPVRFEGMDAVLRYDTVAGPIARVEIPFRVPSGFHCNFYAADSALYRDAFAA